ncbi:hypothetical protein V8E51_006185 [Hyaloscypha variabilis]
MFSTLSAGTITDSAVIASYNRGPLTTIFTPPSSCLSTLTFNSGMYFGHADTYYYDSSCYPSSYSSTYTLLADNGDWNQYYYSPAQCPDAWAHATTFTSYFTNAADTPLGAEVLFSLGSDTTAVLCCPSGYEYFGNAGHQCITTVSTGAELVYVSNSVSDNVLVLDTPATTTVTSSAYTVWGDGIPVWWQSSDLAAFTEPPKTTASSSSTIPTTSTNRASSSTATSTSSGGSTPTSSLKPNYSSGLSSGAKIAVGVTIPVVVIAVVLGIFLFFRRRGKRGAKARHDNIGGEERKYPNDRGELGTEGALSELETRTPCHELPAGQK